MQTIRIIQAAILLTLLALAASCAVTKDYASKVFRPVTGGADSSQRSVRFLETGDPAVTDSGWVSTEVFRTDTTSNQSLKVASIPASDTLKKEPVLTPSSAPPPPPPDSRGVRQKRTRTQ